MTTCTVLPPAPALPAGSPTLVVSLTVDGPFDLALAAAHVAAFPPCAGGQLAFDQPGPGAGRGLARAVDPTTWIEVTQPEPSRLTIAVHSPAAGDPGSADPASSGPVPGGPALAGPRSSGPASGGPALADPAAADPALAERVTELVTGWLSLDDDPTRFLAQAEGDHPAFVERVRAWAGFRPVRFLSLAEATAWFTLNRRVRTSVAEAQRRALITTFGHTVASPHGPLSLFPSFASLLEAGPARLGDVIASPAKGAVLHEVLAGVDACGEEWLRTAPVEEARTGLLAVRGIGPFTADAVLLRALGRHGGEVPIEARSFAGPARAVYGPDWSPAATRARYQGSLGWWGWYVKH